MDRTNVVITPRVMLIHCPSSQVRCLAQQRLFNLSEPDAREGKAPPAPKTTNTRINPLGSDGASALPGTRSFSNAPPAPPTANTRINPRGSDGASALPDAINQQGSDGASALPDARSFGKARTEPRPSQARGHSATLRPYLQPPSRVAIIDARAEARTPGDTAA